MTSPTSNRPAATAVTEKNTNRLISANDESQSHQKPLDTKIPIQVPALWQGGSPMAQASLLVVLLSTCLTGCPDMIYAETAKEVQARRRAFFKLKHYL